MPESDAGSESGGNHWKVYDDGEHIATLHTFELAMQFDARSPFDVEEVSARAE